MPRSYKIIIFTGLIFFALGIFFYFIFWANDGGIYKKDNESLTKSVKVYFSNKLLDPDTMQCDLVSYVKRDVKVSTDGNSEEEIKMQESELLILALTELLRGPTPEDINNSFFTSIPEGVSVKKVDIQNKIANIDFSEELNENVAGSCRVTAIRSQIEKTVLQFTTIEKVIISVNGNSEEILQP